MKIVIINHTFQKNQFCKRWKLLADMHPEWDITLLAPAEWTWGSGSAVTFGIVEIMHGYEYEGTNYHVKKIKIKSKRYFGWTSKEMIIELCKIQPDCVYHIGGHTQESLMQILNYKKRLFPKVKVFAFSMRGPQQDISNIVNLLKNDKKIVKKFFRIFQYLYERSKIKKLNKYCDAIFCHYPDGMNSFRKEGYEGPIFMQTQVGVDTEIFYPDEIKRKTIRDKYNIGDSFLFVSAVRFNSSKGIMQILEALPVEGNWKYMIIGSGLPVEINDVEKKIIERGLKSKVILPGFINWQEMASYWNAADCAIHYAQTTPTWIETFSLSIAQAMATALPVIGSTSGSIPYQIGPDGILVEEHDVEKLHKMIQWVIENQKAAKEIGRKMYLRSMQSFSIKHLNKLFYETVNDLMINSYDINKIDMTNYDF